MVYRRSSWKRKPTYRRKKPAFKPRRRFTFKRRRDPLRPGFTQPSNDIVLKCTDLYPCFVPNGKSEGLSAFSWQNNQLWAQSQNGGESQFWGFNETVRWKSLWEQFEEFKVTGLKLKYVPVAAVSSSMGQTSTNSSINYMLVGTDSNTTDGPFWRTEIYPNLYEKGTVININSRREFKKYFNFKQYSAQQQLKWRKTSEAKPGSAASNLLSEGATYFRFDTHTPVDPEIAGVLQVGTIQATWYVTVRGA